MERIKKYTITTCLFLVVLVLPGCFDGEDQYMQDQAEGSSGFIETPGYSKEVFVEGEFAYIVDGKWGVQIIDISDRTRPSITGNINTSWAWDFYLYGRYGLIADYAEGFVITDLDDKSKPEIILKEDIFVGASSIFVEDDNVYITDHSGKLIIFDITDVTDPLRLSIMEDLGWVYDIFVKDSYGYILFRSLEDNSNWLSIYGLGNLEDPELISTIPVSGPPIEVAVIGDFAYIASGEYGIEVIDISDKREPREVFNLKTGEAATDIFFDSGHLYIADGKQGIKKAVPGDAGELNIIKSWDIPGYSDGIFVLNGYIYIANYDGLLILEDR